jgi:hypothetical protein
LKNLVRRGDVQLTDKAQLAVARYFDQEMMRLVLDKISNTTTIPALMMAAAANNVNGTSIMRLLLEGQDNFTITDDLVAVVRENSNSDDIMELLLRKDGVNVYNETLVMLVRLCNVEAIRLVLDVQEDILIMDEVVKEAALN